MVEFLLTWVGLLPTLPDEWKNYSWEGDDGGTIQQFVHLYNQQVTDNAYLYHQFNDGVNYIYDEDLPLDWHKFRYSESVTGEREILTPQLEKLGFSNISWRSGESDSFGDLTRCATMTDSCGSRVTFVYG